MLSKKLVVTVISAVFALGALGAPAYDDDLHEKRDTTSSTPPSPSTTTPYTGKPTTLTGLARPPLTGVGDTQLLEFMNIGGKAWSVGLGGIATATTTITESFPTTVSGQKTVLTTTITVSDILNVQTDAYDETLLITGGSNDTTHTETLSCDVTSSTASCQLSLDSGFASVGTPTIVTSTGIHMKQIKFGATPYFTHSFVPSSAMSSVESALEGSGSTASNSKRTSSSSGESADPRRAQAKPRTAH